MAPLAAVCTTPFVSVVLPYACFHDTYCTIKSDINLVGVLVQGLFLTLWLRYGYLGSAN